LNLFPAFSGRAREFLTDGALLSTSIRRPRCVDGGVRGAGIGIEKNDVRVDFRRLDDNERSGNYYRPPNWSREGGSAECGDLLIRGEFLGGSGRRLRGGNESPGHEGNRQ